MRQRWTLNIEEFGKIESAKIDVTPLMLFVGENNTGKSYIMTLLWGILTAYNKIFDYRNSTAEAFKKCSEWLKSRINQDDIVIDEEAQILFVNWFNELLKRNKKDLVIEIFNYPVSIGQLYITNYKRETPLKIKMVREPSKTPASENEIKFSFPPDSVLSNSRVVRMINTICWRLLAEDLASPYLPIGLLHFERRYRGPLYLPASRTGFMLTYKTLLQNLIGSGFSIDNDPMIYKSTFTKPVISFLQALVDINFSEKNRYYDIAEFLEKEILIGEVKRDDAPMPNFTYRPTGSKDDMPMYVTSSLVSELTPIIAFLKSQNNYKVFIIEEPEAHLHPELQRVLVKAIATLVNRGLPVWITTHSDTIFQQVNNLIKLGDNRNRQELMQSLGYNEDQIIRTDQVSAYQFTTTDNRKSQVQALELDKYGFAVPTFNETIIKLSKETIALQENDEDVE